MTGIQAIRPIKAHAASTRVFIMTTFYDSLHADQAQRDGAAGFLLKNDDLEEVAARLRDASRDWAGGASGPAPAPWQPRAIGGTPAARAPSRAQSAATRTDGAKAATPDPALHSIKKLVAAGLRLLRTDLTIFRRGS
jgi:DNA-binding NarL/FixJ family response regulator